jgi:NAD(P)-dependent dehydrogenase (short-subunit alcohol dehydrogenase family)
VTRPGRLDGEVALITGSTSGLGKEIATVFTAEGASVLVTGRDERRGRAVVDAICSARGKAAFLAADLNDEDERRALIDGAEAAFGALTILVNNAVTASGGDGPITEVSAQDWEAILRVDLGAAAAMCRLAIPAMTRAGHGAIVNVSSRAATRGTPGVAAYSAAKGALEALARSITADYTRSGIRCNTVQPGYILHERRDADLGLERRERLAAMHLTRVPTATDVAYAVLFLASSEADVISGVTLPVDGGSSAVRGLTLG